MPNTAYTWNCKYRVSIEKTSQETLKASNGGKAGFLTVTTEAFGFGGNIEISAQKNDAWGSVVGNDLKVYNNALFA